METKSLKQRLTDYFLKHHTEIIPSGELQRMVANHTTYSPANVTRRLREMAEDGELDVTYIKGHAHYSLKQRQLQLL